MRTTKVWKQPKCAHTVQANCGDYRGSLMTPYQRQWVRRSFMSQVHVHTWPAMTRGGTWRTRKKQGSGSRGKPFSPPCWPLCGDDWCMISVEDFFDFWVKGQSLRFVWLVVAAFWEGIILLPTQGMPPAKLQWCTPTAYDGTLERACLKLEIPVMSVTDVMICYNYTLQSIMNFLLEGVEERCWGDRETSSKIPTWTRTSRTSAWGGTAYLLRLQGSWWAPADPTGDQEPMDHRSDSSHWMEKNLAGLWPEMGTPCVRNSTDTCAFHTGYNLRTSRRPTWPVYDLLGRYLCWGAKEQTGLGGEVWPWCSQFQREQQRDRHHRWRAQIVLSWNCARRAGRPRGDTLFWSGNLAPWYKGDRICWGQGCLGISNLYCAIFNIC